MNVTARRGPAEDLDLADCKRQMRHGLSAAQQAGNGLQGTVEDAGMENELVKPGPQVLGDPQLAQRRGVTEIELLHSSERRPIADAGFLEQIVELPALQGLGAALLQCLNGQDLCDRVM